jgi:phosphoribosylformylglycinamidine cyclo-ligase
MSTYAEAGVDIEAGNETVRRIKDKVKRTHTGAVLTNIGSFGSLFDLKEILTSYKQPILVQSIDGVGTKILVAEMAGSYRGVGHDIVNHCSNDIVAMGAKPITFLDYVAQSKLDPAIMEEIVSGMAEACQVAGIALIGGETAEMPGVYMPGQHDIAGSITGIVEKDKIITGKDIAAGDVVLGLSSNGLQTNGFSLARKVFFEKGFDINSNFPELGEKTLGEALLEVHQNYAPAILNLIDHGIKIKGIAHITGGGFLENIPRVLSGVLNAEISLGTWPVLPIFNLIQSLGGVDQEEMFRVFNMGIGIVLVVSPENADATMEKLAEYTEFKTYKIGVVAPGDKKVILK